MTKPAMIYLRLLLLSIPILLIFKPGFSQLSQLEIKVLNPGNESLPGATVRLAAGNDAGTRFTVTDQQGIAVFSRIQHGNYGLKISFMGYKTLDTTIQVREAHQHAWYTLEPDALNLEAVSVVARRPVIRQEDDKMIVDPESIASSTTNTLEVLESTPGLYVDPDGGIYLSASTAATIYINGREQKMSNQDIATILRSLPPNSVDRIEIMRTPSTRYDAASSGGIINIVLKKGVKIGRFGSVHAGMNQGQKGNRFAGFSVNHSNNRSSTYLNVNYNNNEQLDELNSTRYLSADTSLVQASDATNSSHQVYLGLGSNYEYNERTNFSFDTRLNATDRSTESENRNITSAVSSGKLLESNNLALTDALVFNVQQDLAMTTKFDTLGSQLDLRFGYSYNNSGSSQDYSTEFDFPIDYRSSGNGSNHQYRHFLSLQGDLTYFLPFRIKLETGGKSSWQKLNSDAEYFTDLNNTPVKDLTRTNKFGYAESINSMYLQASRKLFGELQLKTGFRIERTYMNGNQHIPSDTSFVINRADWFPYVYLSRDVFSIMGADLTAYLIYRKTISRPGYQELNPYSRYIDQYLSESGNPALRPQLTDNFELNISFEDMPVFAVGRNITTDIFTSVMYQDDEQEEHLLRTYDNLGKNTETYFRGMIGIPPGGKYFFAMGAQYNYNHYEGFYQNNPMNYSRGSWRFFTFHSLTLLPNTKLTVNGFMMTRGQWNFYEMENFGQLNVGLTQTFLDKKLSITLNGRDILKTMVTSFDFNQGSIQSSGNRYTDNRRFGFNIRYNFGLKKKEENRNMPGFEEPEL